MSIATVVAASRDFICARLGTYENAAEAKLLTGIFVGRSGELENTTFVLLAPDGKTTISRAGRGPKFLMRGRHGDADELTKIIRDTAAKYRPKKKAAALPQTYDMRRALNIAACDKQPLVIVRASSTAKRAVLEKRLAVLAWKDEFVGRFHYAVVDPKADKTAKPTLKEIKDLPSGDGVYVVRPGKFGITGEVIAKLPAKASDEKLHALLLKTDREYTAAGTARHHRDHVRDGRRNGIEWETEIPVTDPGAARARGGGR